MKVHVPLFKNKMQFEEDIFIKRFSVKCYLRLPRSSITKLKIREVQYQLMDHLWGLDDIQDLVIFTVPNKGKNDSKLQTGLQKQVTQVQTGVRQRQLSVLPSLIHVRAHTRTQAHYLNIHHVTLKKPLQCYGV